MKKFITKMILVSFVLSLSVAVQAAVTNVFEWDATLANLSIQPQANDLVQQPGVTTTIIKGGMYNSTFLLEYLFDSDAYGSYGSGNNAGIFKDEISPENDTAIICDFGSAKTIGEVHVFTQWGDRRIFSWFQVWVSTTGTNDADYSYIGAASFGDPGDAYAPYAGQNCVARLYDNEDGILATGVTSVKLVQQNSAYGTLKQIPGTSTNGIAPIDSCACRELDIIEFTEPTTISNVYYSELNLGNLPLQPQSDDLAQSVDATNYIVAGGMHTALSDNKFEYLFNSPVDGDLGVGSPDTSGGTEVLLYDAPIPETITMEMNCDFSAPKIVQAIQVFSLAGDPRIFNYGEVSYSTTGTNPSDYTYLGAVSFGEWGDSSDIYANSNCVARLFDSADGILAENVTSVKIKFLGVMDTTWADLNHKVFGSSGGSAIGEVDIIGIPEPATLLVSGLLLGLAFIRRK